MSRSHAIACNLIRPSNDFKAAKASAASPWERRHPCLLGLQ